MTHELPIHFFTIVLNGEPFIRYHIDMLRQLPAPWHWHIVEGVAALTRDTAWSVAGGGHVAETWHREGRSIDGTSEYLDQLATADPEHVTVYRKPRGEFWDGKREMVNAPLPTIHEECLLWEIDADELWTTSQVMGAHDMFSLAPQKTAAYYFCHFFLGSKLMITSIDAYANNTRQEWVRTWRYLPGDKWLTHEPPRLGRKEGAGWRDVASIDPFRHRETAAQDLIFQHYAYVLPEQLQFKESYYGYRDALRQWEQLQQARVPARLADHVAWVTDEAVVDSLVSQGVHPIAQQNSNGQWDFSPAAATQKRTYPYIEHYLRAHSDTRS